MRNKHPNGIGKQNNQVKVKSILKKPKLGLDTRSLKNKLAVYKAKKAKRGHLKLELENRNLSSCLANFEWENDAYN